MISPRPRSIARNPGPGPARMALCGATVESSTTAAISQPQMTALRAGVAHCRLRGHCAHIPDLHADAPCSAPLCGTHSRGGWNRLRLTGPAAGGDAPAPPALCRHTAGPDATRRGGRVASRLCAAGCERSASARRVRNRSGPAPLGPTPSHGHRRFSAGRCCARGAARGLGPPSFGRASIRKGAVDGWPTVVAAIPRPKPTRARPGALRAPCVRVPHCGGEGGSSAAP